MKNIIIVNHYAGSPKHGMRFRDYDIAVELKNQGWNVAIIAASFSHLRLKNPDTSSEIIDGIHYYWIPVPKYRKLGIGRILNMMMFTVNHYTRNLTLPFKPDVVVASSPSPFAVLNGFLLKRKYKAKFIYEIRDIWPLSIMELKGSSKYHPLVLLFGWIDKLGLRNADAILSPLRNISEYVKEKGFERRVIIVPNGISTMDIGVERKNVPGDCFVVGYGGSLSDSNSIMNLIHAARILKNEKIVFKIVGSGERREDIQKYIELENLHNIELIGQVPKRTFWEVMATCDILYKGNPEKNLYKYGVSSIKMVEYLLLKKPLIDASFGVDIVEKSGGGLMVEPENSQALADGILKLKAMRTEELEKMGEQGFIYATENYLYKNTIGNMIKELNSIQED